MAKAKAKATLEPAIMMTITAHLHPRQLHPHQEKAAKVETKEVKIITNRGSQDREEDEEVEAHSLQWFRLCFLSIAT